MRRKRLTACSAQGLDRIYGFPFVRGPLNSFFRFISEVLS